MSRRRKTPALVVPIAADSVVRPESFHLPEVSGLLIPSIVAVQGVPVGQWLFYERWHDPVKRCFRPFTSTLLLPDGRTIWFHPQPAAAPSTPTRFGWSQASCDGWLAGAFDPPDPADLFNRLRAQFDKYLVLRPETADGELALLALYSIMTYFYRCLPSLPYLHIAGIHGCGKTRVLELLQRVAFRPLLTANVTGPFVFRVLDNQGGTLLYDEAKAPSGSNEDAKLDLLLAGYRRGGSVGRLENPSRKAYIPARFDVYGPKVLAGTNFLDAALQSRCLSITMLRAGNDPKARLLIGDDEAVWQSLRDDLHVMTLEHGRAWPALAKDCGLTPPGLGAREIEIWRPLFAMAGWLEGHGVSGLLATLEATANRLAEESHIGTVRSCDEVLLSVLADAVARGEQGQLTPTELLRRAQDVDGVFFRSWGPEAVGRALANFGIVSKSDGKRRTYKHVRSAQLHSIAEQYRLCITTPERLVFNTCQQAQDDDWQ